MQEFTEKAKQKFDEGVKKYGPGFENINHKKELEQELFDAYNYVEGLKQYNTAILCNTLQKQIIHCWKLSRILKENIE